MDNFIEISHVWKKFRRGKKLLLKEALIDAFKPSFYEHFWSLKDVSFDLQKGCALGIVGPNGSGKSTILKIIAGVMSPTKGSVKVTGRIAPLIELAAGFHPELTGRENVYLNGTILGMTKKEIDEKFESIVNFSGLKEYIDTPVKHYSTGMYMRLGFAVVVHSNAEIFLVDEILAVGDAEFQKKCVKKMREFKDNGAIIIFVSHDLKTVSEFCDEVIYLDKGRLLSRGAPKKVIEDYHNKKIIRWGDGEMSIEEVWVNKKNGRNNVFKAGDIKLSFSVKSKENVKDPVFGISIKNDKDEEVLAANTHWNKQKTGEFSRNQEIVVTFDISNRLPSGTYWVTPAIAHSNLLDNYDWRSNMLSFTVSGETSGLVLTPQVSITIDQ